MLRRARWAESSMERLPLDSEVRIFLMEGALHGFNVPTVATGEIGTARALYGDTTIGGTGEIGEAGWEIGLAAFAVGDGILSLRRLALENFGRSGRGERLFLFKFVDVDGVFLGLGFLGLGLFLVETLGGVNSAAFGRGDGGLRHGNAGAADEADLYAGVAATTDAAPGVAGALDPDANEEEGRERNVKPGRVTEEAVEGEVVESVGGLRHGVRTG